MRVFGIRREADTTGPWSDYVVGAVNLLNEHLNPRGSTSTSTKSTPTRATSAATRSMTCTGG